MTENTLDVMVVAANERYYIPKFLTPICESELYNITAIVTVPPSLGTENIVQFGLRLFRTFGPRVFAKHALFYSKCMVRDFLNRIFSVGASYSPKTIAQRHDIEYTHTKDINNPSFTEYVESNSPEVIASVATTQKFEKRLLDIPSKGAINVHSSLLPEYRGVSPSFWTLLHGEEQTGISVHYMDENIDTGDLIKQRPLKIEDEDTLHSLNKRVAREGAEVLLEALDDIRRDSVERTPINPDKGSYYSMPSREDVQKFIDQGNDFY